MRLYTTTPTANCWKIHIALEELGLAYEPVSVPLESESRYEPWFEKLCPNNKIPVLEDDDGTVVWESGAILLYLAERHDPEGRILSADPKRRFEAIQYAFFQAAGLGPNLGRLSTQLRLREGERNAEMTALLVDEVDRIFGVLDRILADGRSFLAGEYSIADIMHYPWLQPVRALAAPQLMERPRVVEWIDRTGARPAVASAPR